MLVCLSLWELRFQDGGRVFLIGEGLMAGAEKRATICLLSYSNSHSDQDLQCFKTELDVALGRHGGPSGAGFSPKIVHSYL